MKRRVDEGMVSSAELESGPAAGSPHALADLSFPAAGTLRQFGVTSFLPVESPVRI
jgi:hypothetical protein